MHKVLISFLDNLLTYWMIGDIQLHYSRPTE